MIVEPDKHRVYLPFEAIPSPRSRRSKASCACRSCAATGSCTPSTAAHDRRRVPGLRQPGRHPARLARQPRVEDAAARDHRRAAQAGAQGRVPRLRSGDRPRARDARAPRHALATAYRRAQPVADRASGARAIVAKSCSGSDGTIRALRPADASMRYLIDCRGARRLRRQSRPDRRRSRHLLAGSRRRHLRPRACHRRRRRPTPARASRSSASTASSPPGARVEQTLGFTDADRATLPIEHVVVIMQENRSFDHYLGRLTQCGPRRRRHPGDLHEPEPGRRHRQARARDHDLHQPRSAARLRGDPRRVEQRQDGQLLQGRRVERPRCSARSPGTTRPTSPSTTGCTRRSP